MITFGARKHPEIRKREKKPMPIYEYQCNACDKRFEYLVLGGDAPEGCPSCRSKKVSRLMSACGFVSKGKGGETVSKSAGSSCTGCTAGSCASCG